MKNNKLYSVIDADPPWEFEDKLVMSDVKRGAESQYMTMSIKEIMNLPIQRVIAKDAILALWVPDSLLKSGLEVLEKWGFIQKQVYTWIKMTKGNKVGFGMGHYFRTATEHALIGIRGKPEIRSHSERNVDSSINKGHSIKPETLQEKLERMCEGPYLELFARRLRENWTCVGLEVPGNEMDVREFLMCKKKGLESFL